jgi:flagellar protein FlaG
VQIGEIQESKNITEIITPPVQQQIQHLPVKQDTVNEGKQKKDTNELIRDNIKGGEKEQEPTRLSKSELNDTIEELNKHFKMFNTRLSFSYNEEKNLSVIKIQDRKSGEVIKQIPPEEMLQSLSKISSIVGLLIDRML